MPYTSATAVLNTAVLRRLRAARAVEDAVGLLLASATFSVTMAGMLLAVSEDVYYWKQIVPMILVSVLAGIMIIYFMASLWVSLAKAQSRFTSYFSDLFWLAPTYLAWIAFAAYSSWSIKAYPDCGQTRYKRYAAATCPLTIASMAFAWICAVFTFILLLVRLHRYKRVYAPIKASLTELAQMYPAPMVERSSKA